MVTFGLNYHESYKFDRSEMNNRDAYNVWADNYDTVQNKTRDMEALVLRTVLSDLAFSEVIEIGCGTGKNTQWIATKAKQVTAVDFSQGMLEKAKEKINLPNVHFIRSDITTPWNFMNKKADLITCSLILEHIRNIGFIFEQAKSAILPGGFFYIGELHPFKQYQGSKARFDTAHGTFELDCYVHHISDYADMAKKNNFECMDLREWFDDDNRNAAPRLLSMVFRNG